MALEVLVRCVDVGCDQNSPSRWRGLTAAASTGARRNCRQGPTAAGTPEAGPCRQQEPQLRHLNGGRPSLLKGGRPSAYLAALRPLCGGRPSQLTEGRPCCASQGQPSILGRGRPSEGRPSHLEGGRPCEAHACGVLGAWPSMCCTRAPARSTLLVDASSLSCPLCPFKGSDALRAASSCGRFVAAFCEGAEHVGGGYAMP